jgi:integrase
MPKRYSTRRGYEVWLRCYLVPRWGNSPITCVRARDVELWLGTLALSPKSKAELRGLLRILWEFAMWAETIPAQRNPMELIRIKGASKRTRQPRSLTVEEFQKFVVHLSEPFRTVALICVCFGLRISECLALRWNDVNWLEGKLRVERGIVRGRVDDTKTTYSERAMAIDEAMLAVLKTWKQASQFSSETDWLFASPAQLGRQPWSYDQVWKAFRRAGEAAGIGKLGTHTMRHSFRAWLDSFGTPLGLQRELMRHSDIRTTMRYGKASEPQMAQAHHQVVSAALAKAN